MFYLRIDRRFGQLVQLVSDCFKELSIFLAFYVLLLVFFSLVAQVLGSEIGSEDESEYPHLGTFWVFLLQAARNSIGDLATPTYAYWES